MHGWLGKYRTCSLMSLGRRFGSTAFASITFFLGFLFCFELLLPFDEDGDEIYEGKNIWWEDIHELRSRGRSGRWEATDRRQREELYWLTVLHARMFAWCGYLHLDPFLDLLLHPYLSMGRIEVGEGFIQYMALFSFDTIFINIQSSISTFGAWSVWVKTSEGEFNWLCSLVPHFKLRAGLGNHPAMIASSPPTFELYLESFR